LPQCQKCQKNVVGTLVIATELAKKRRY
jgi:hypothetical protein